MNFQEGVILCFDKPYRWTSFDAVNKIRGTLCRRLGVRKLKVGHAGTLDPLATGVIVVCTGRATKRIEELQAHTKEYVATLCLGATTPSFDLEHPIDATYPVAHITRQRLEEVLTHFVGSIQQVPPSYSACKIQGDHAYALMRRGEEVTLKPKTLVIDEIELLNYAPHLSSSPSEPFEPFEPSLAPPLWGGVGERPIPSFDSISVTLRVVCSKGTYIRALARDIGEALGSGAHLTALRRTRVGDIRVEDCMQVEAFPQWLDARLAAGEVVDSRP